MDDSTSGLQLTQSAAEIYESFFVPALFSQFAPHLARELRLARGHRVLDVACGTGVLAREAAQRVAPGGTVTAIDRNPGMLAVARRMVPTIEWHEGMAETLPFAAADFDAVGCQFALMFFEDRVAALKEMWRVLRPGGRLAVAVWAPLESAPGYHALALLLDRLFGAATAAALQAPFGLGDQGTLLDLFQQAGIAAPRLQREPGTARFASIEALIHTEIRGWILADAIDDSQYARLLREALTVLAPYAAADGRVSFPVAAHIVGATKV